MGGTLSADPIYVTSWQTRPQLPQAVLPGWWDGLPGSWDRRYLAVEWRPYTFAWRRASFSDMEAERCQGSALETCFVPYVEIGNAGPVSWIAPWIGACEERVSVAGLFRGATDLLEDCRFLDDLGLEDRIREWEHFAMTTTVASAELVMPDE